MKRLILLISMIAGFVSTSFSQNYMDVLQRYAPYYYKNFKIQSSELQQPTSYRSIYKFVATNGLEITVTLSMCWTCAGTGKSAYNGYRGCSTCGSTGKAAIVSAYQPANKMFFDAEGRPPYGGSAVAGSSGSSGSSKSKTWKNCHSCGGGGGCRSCNGTGINTVTKSGNCGACHGTGICPACRGEKGHWY